MRKGFLVLVLFVPGFLVFPQSQSPHLVAHVDGKAETLPVAQVEVTARVVGCIAETRITLTFKNPHRRVLEGELVFPLPEGATISGYALDVNGLMVDGVVVEQNKGRRVFEKIVRRGVDPGLAEWVKGNVFRTRVYPIRAGGSRKVMVRYVSEIETGASEHSYRLPLSFPGKVEELHLRIEVVRPGDKPVTPMSAGKALEFSQWQGGYRTEGSWRNIELSQDLVIELPRREEGATYVERSEDGNCYFLIPEFPPPDRQAAIARPAPKRIYLLWDSSGSLAEADHSRKLRVLRDYLTQWLHSRPEVELVVFRNRPQAASHFEGTREGINALLAELESLPYDGGTQLSGLREAFGPGAPDLYLLFTDGLGNFGEQALDSFDAPVYAISDSPFTNLHLLRHLAQSTGGDYFNLVTSDEQQVVQAIGSSARVGLTTLDARGKTADIFHTSPSANHPFSVVGKLLSEDAELVLSTAVGTQETASAKARYSLLKDEAVPGELLRTYWAQQKVERFMADPVRFRRELIDIGREFGLVTPGTSLIVLETLDQYLEFRIAPPTSLPEMRAKWTRAMKDRKADAKDDGKSKLEHIMELWQKRLEWWKTDFSEKRDRAASAASSAERVRSDASPAAAPRPVPPSAPVAASAPLANSPSTPPVVQVNRPAPCLVLGDAAEPGTTVGTIKDPSGGFIPGAEVTFANQRSGAKKVFISDDCGIYRAAGLAYGLYTVSVDLPGFRQRVVDRVPVGQGPRRLDIELRVGDVTEMVTVSASAPELQTATSEMSTVVSSASVSGYQPMVLSGMVMGGNGRSGGRSGNRSSTSRPGNEQGEQLYVEVQEWNPDTPYLTVLKKALPGTEFLVYLEQRKSYGASPAFYLDCSDFFADRGQRELALQVLSNIAEVCLADPAFLRILGHRLAQLGYLELAAQVFEEVLALRPEEPQSLRDLALVLAERGQYGRAVELLRKVVMDQWDRFDGIEVIALNELNRIVPLAKAAGLRDLGLDPGLIRSMDADLRVVLTWDADATDMDLWVTEPTGEKAFYKNQLTQLGGLVSRDFTQGYGPEEYMLRKAVRGKYRIDVNYFGSNAQKLQGPVTVQVEIFTNFGRPNETRKSVTLRLTDKKDVHHIADVEM